MRTLVNLPLSYSVAAVFLAGCGVLPLSSSKGQDESQSAIGVPRAMQTLAAASSPYRVVYNFGGGPNGADPVADLVNVNGTLYGTTQIGGKYEKNGTVFKITRAGEHRVVHSFGNGDDGVTPLASLVDVNGTLYGTTEAGGSGTCRDEQGEAGCGVVYSISQTGEEKVLYSFARRSRRSVSSRGLG